MAGGFVSPVEGSAIYERIDQGVDYKGLAGSFIHAIGSGLIYRVGGQWNTIYEQLDTPVVIGGHRYNQIYYAESNPLSSIRAGTRVAAGQPLAQYTSGNPWSEIGFAQGTSWGPLLGGLGSSTLAGTRGLDFAAFIRELGAPGIPSDLAGVPNIAPGAQAPNQAPHVPGSKVPAYLGFPPGAIWGSGQYAGMVVDPKTGKPYPEGANAQPGQLFPGDPLTPGNVGKAAGAIAQPFEAIGKLVAKLVWLFENPGRVGMFLGGAVLLVLALVLIGRRAMQSDTARAVAASRAAA